MGLPSVVENYFIRNSPQTEGIQSAHVFLCSVTLCLQFRLGLYVICFEDQRSRKERPRSRFPQGNREDTREPIGRAHDTDHDGAGDPFARMNSVMC